SWWIAANGGVSIHRSTWPTELDLGSAAAADPACVDAVAAALAGLRGVKSTAKVSQRAELSRAEITGPELAIQRARSAAEDLRRTGRITGELVFTVDETATELSVSADLAPTES
ncbi:MAG: valine--tRNA ligase, partial [Nocardioidaceae bacterium]|nr:valine--tRNA ligase [Nocardioidaceae bacterium]